MFKCKECAHLHMMDKLGKSYNCPMVLEYEEGREGLSNDALWAKVELGGDYWNCKGFEPNGEEAEARS